MAAQSAAGRTGKARSQGKLKMQRATNSTSFEKVLQKLDKLYEDMGGLRQEIISLQKMHAPPPAPPPPPPVLPKLPMKTSLGFKALEKFLEDKNNFEYMVSYLKKCKNPTPEEKANGMLSALFSLKFADFYNYSKTSTGKRAFVGTRAEKAVRRAAEESFRGHEPKKYMVPLRKWFRNVRFNLKKQEKAKKPKKARAS